MHRLDIDRAPGRLRRGTALSGDLGQFTVQYRGNYRSIVRWFVGPVPGTQKEKVFRFPDACLICHRSFKKLVATLDGGLTAGRNWSQMLYRIDLLRERFRAAVR